VLALACFNAYAVNLHLAELGARSLMATQHNAGLQV
jgi:hypothetical protein